MNRDYISQSVFENIFKTHAVKVEVFLKGGKEKAASYDKYRDTGYTKTVQNPVFVKAMTKAISPNSLIIRELGLTQTGAIQILVKDADVNILKTSFKIKHNNIEYTSWNEALGNKFQHFASDHNGYSKVILFRIDK